MSQDWQTKLQAWVSSQAFQRFILLVILIAALLVGIETYPHVVARYGGLIHALNTIVLWIFVFEAVVKMAQHGRAFYRYFLDPWNVFDFVIVVVCFLPINASYAAVLRLARVMRALRLMTVLPRLQLLVGALIKSIPSMVYVGVLLALSFYIYAVIGVFLFRENDPVHFRNLQIAMLSLFRVVTLEDWTDVMYIQMLGSDVYAYSNTTGLPTTPHGRPLVGALYFVSFVMFGTMIMLNLFIGVILNSMDEAEKEREMEHYAETQARGDATTLSDDLDTVRHQLASLQEAFDRLSLRIQADQK